MSQKKSEIFGKALVALTAVTGLSGQMHATGLSPDQITRAWKDARFYRSLSAEQKRLLPANPAGEVSVTGAVAMAGFGTYYCSTGGTCTTSGCTAGGGCSAGPDCDTQQSVCG
jgi:mersacidin/lichenicidin family type 2 lantibiotic